MRLPNTPTIGLADLFTHMMADTFKTDEKTTRIILNINN